MYYYDDTSRISVRPPSGPFMPEFRNLSLSVHNMVFNPKTHGDPMQISGDPSLSKFSWHANTTCLSGSKQWYLFLFSKWDVNLCFGFTSMFFTFESASRQKTGEAVEFISCNSLLSWITALWLVLPMAENSCFTYFVKLNGIKVWYSLPWSAQTESLLSKLSEFNSNYENMLLHCLVKWKELH